MLEVIKHFFGIKNIVFVLAVDKTQLENSVRTLFGITKGNEEGYLKKFIEVEIPLNPFSAREKNIQNFIQAQYRKSIFYKKACSDEYESSSVALQSKEPSEYERQDGSVGKRDIIICNSTKNDQQNVNIQCIGKYDIIYSIEEDENGYRALGLGVQGVALHYENYDSIHEWATQYLIDIAKVLNFTLRDIERFFIRFNITIEQCKNMDPILLDLIIVLNALSIQHNELLIEYITGNRGGNSILDAINSIMPFWKKCFEEIQENNRLRTVKFISSYEYRKTSFGMTRHDDEKLRNTPYFYRLLAYLEYYLLACKKRNDVNEKLVVDYIKDYCHRIVSLLSSIE